MKEWQMMNLSIVSVMLIFFIATACYCDIKYKKIYNWLTLPFLVFGIFINTYSNGMGGLCLAITGMLIGFAILLLPYKWGWIGGGDVKFLAAAGSVIGPVNIATSTIYGLMLFGVVAVFYLISKGLLINFIKQLAITVFAWKHIKGINLIQVSGRLPMGVFLGVAILVNYIYKNL